MPKQNDWSSLSQKLIRIGRIGWDYARNHGFSLSQCAGFIRYESVYLACVFQCLSATDKYTLLRAAPRAISARMKIPPITTHPRRALYFTGV